MIPQTSLNRKILSLAIPAIVSNITIPLLGLSDTAIAGHLGSDLFLAAMAVGATMMNLSSWLFGFLRMGTAGLSATSYGARDARSLSRIFCRTLVLGFFIGVLMVLFRYPLSRLLVSLLSPGPEIAEEATLYYSICILAAPAQLATMAMGGWMVGMQSTFWPMIVAIVTNAANIPLSLLLVFGVKTGFAGLAVGTAVAQWVGFILALWFCIRLWRKFRTENPDFSGMSIFSELKNSLRHSAPRSFMTMNSALLIRSACIMAVSMGMTAFAGRLGETALGANTIMLQFFTFFSFFMDGFAHASEAMVGSAAGGGDKALLSRYVRRLLMWAVSMGLLFLLVYLFCGQTIVRLLTDSRAVREAIAGMSWIPVLIPPVSVMAFIFDGFYIGLTKTVPMMWATIVSSCCFFIIIWLSGGMESSGIGLWDLRFSQILLWAAFLTYLFLRGSILGALFTHFLKIKK